MMFKTWLSASISLSLLALTFSQLVNATPVGGTSWNEKKRITTVTIHGLPRFTPLKLFVPSYTYRTIGKTDDCNVLIARSDDFPVRPGDGSWQHAQAGGKAFYWQGSGALNDASYAEPKCVNGVLQNVDPTSWRVWANTGVVKYYDANSGYTPNTEYAVTFLGNYYGQGNSGRSLTTNIKTNTCGTAKFDIKEHWDGDLKTGMGKIYNYVADYEIRTNAGNVLYRFRPSDFFSTQGAVCKKGNIYLPR